MAEEKYKRTVSADDSGYQYELKMTALVALRLYNKSDEFYLANNFERGEKFDDIVFSAKISDKWTTSFIQLKHKQRSSLASRRVTIPSLNSRTNSNKSDYDLTKYFQSYKMIAKKFNSTSQDVIFGRDYDCAKFLIFTNAHLGEDVMKREFTPVDIDYLSSAPSREKNIQFDLRKHGDIFVQLGSEKTLLSDFLKKLYLCSSQACEDECDTIVDTEIKYAAKYLSDNEVKFVRGQLYDFLRRWYKTGEYLTKEKVNSLLSQKSVESQSGKKSGSSISFTPGFLQQVLSQFKSDRLIFFSNKGDSTILCNAALQQLHLTEPPNQYLSWHQIVNNEFKEHFLVKFKEQSDIYAVIDCSEGNPGTKFKDTVQAILDLSNSNDKNKILLIGSSENEDAVKLAAAVKAKRRNFSCTLLSLNNEYKMSVLERDIYFQGYKAPLSSISNNSLEGLIQMNVISSLISGQKFEIGVQPIASIPYYVTRVLIRPTFTCDIFQLCDLGVKFALSQVTLAGAKKSLPNYSNQIEGSTAIINGKTSVSANIIVLESTSPSKEFTLLTKKFGRLHWLAKKFQFWTWKGSNSNVSECITYCGETPEYYPTENIMKISDKVVVIVAEPGMGKSTLLVHVAAETKRQLPSVWVVLVTLNDFTEILDRSDFLKNADTCVRDIIAEAAGITSTASKFDARLFENCYKQGNMIVLLDGFDEITPYYTEQGLAILRVLSESPIQRIWVTARPNMKDILINATNCIPFSIKPFYDSDQRHFLQKYWSQTVPNLDKEKANIFIAKIIELVQNTFSGDMEEFTGIPLQTRMLAEMFENEIRNYNETGELILPQKVNALQLFQAFVEKKMQVLEEKSKIVATNALARSQLKKLRDDAEERLMKLGLLTLLKAEECALLHPPITKFNALELKDDVTNGADKTGIVISFKGDAPQFIHRTFAEYFVARFFSQNAKENAKFLTSVTFNSSSFNFVRSFYNRLLSVDSELHCAVLDNELEKVKALLRSSASTELLDKCGRTPLHLAASLTKGGEMIQLLLDAGADQTVRDKIQQFTPFDFALATHNVGNIAPLLSVDNFSRLSTTVVPIDFQSLKTAASGDHTLLLQWLLEKGIVSQVGIDVLPPYQWVDDVELCFGFTYLHLAAAWDASKVLNYLLRKDSRDSKLWLLDRTNNDGETALLVAATRGCSKAVKSLLKAGANIECKTKSGQNAVDLAVAQKDFDSFTSILRAIMENNMTPETFLSNALLALVADKSDWAPNALVFLLHTYPNLSSTVSKGDMPLIAFAVSKCNDLALKILIRLGSNVNVSVKSHSLLHMAAERGCYEVMVELLACPGINVDPVDDLGQTPLYLATCKGFSSLVQLLIEHGADIHCKTKDGDGLSHAAANAGDESLVAYLAEKGVDFSLINGDQQPSFLCKIEPVASTQAANPSLVENVVQSSAASITPTPPGPPIAAAKKTKKAKQPEVSPQNVSEPKGKKKKRKKKGQAAVCIQENFDVNKLTELMKQSSFLQDQNSEFSKVLLSLLQTNVASQQSKSKQTPKKKKSVPNVGTGAGNKLSNDISSQDVNKVFIEGIVDHEVNDLKEYFSAYGDVIFCNIPVEKDSGKKTGFAFLQYGDSSSVANACLQKYHMVKGTRLETKKFEPQLKVDDQKSNNPLEAKKATAPAKKKSKGNLNCVANNQVQSHCLPIEGHEDKKIFITGIVDHEFNDLKQYFAAYGDVISCFFPVDEDSGKKKGIAFLEYGDNDSVANACLQKYHMVKGSRLEVTKCIPRTDVDNAMAPSKLGKPDQPKKPPKATKLKNDKQAVLNQQQPVGESNSSEHVKLPKKKKAPQEKKPAEPNQQQSTEQSSSSPKQVKAPKQKNKAS